MPSSSAPGGAGMMRGNGRKGKAVLLVDHAEAPGKKIHFKWCNFTNVFTAADRYISVNPHFAKSALGRYRPEDFIALVEAHRIAWHEERWGVLL